jgi:hypothetical protein
MGEREERENRKRERVGANAIELFCQISKLGLRGLINILHKIYK